MPKLSEVQGQPKRLKLSQVQQQPKQSQRGSFVRDAGLSVRSGLEGIAGIPDFFGGPVRWALEKTVGPQTTFTELADRLSDKIGLPEPETARERVMTDVNRALSGTVATMGAGGAAANLPGNAGLVGRFLASNPRLQVAGAAAGAGASGVTRESGGGTGAQIAAGLVGGLAPSVATTAPQMVARGLVRGGEAGRQTVQRNIDSFAAAGTTPTVGQAAANWRMRALESLQSKLPGSAGVIAAKAESQADDISHGVRRLADTLAPGADATTAGEAIRRGIVGDDGFRGGQSFQQRTGEVADRLYSALDDQIPQGARVGVGGTESALNRLNVDIPGAPALSQQFRNARISGIQGGFADDTQGVQALMTRDGVPEWADEVRMALQLEADDIAAQNAQRRALMLPELPVPTAADIESQVQGRVAAMVDGRLPYEAVQKTRTLVGKQIANNNFASDVPTGDWRLLYGGLSDDMGAAAADAGPDAMRAFNRANKYYGATQKRSEAISHVVNRETPEEIFNAAMRGTKDGATTLTKLLRSLPDTSRKEVASAVLARLGRATKGQQNADGTAFSTSTFLSNWAELGPRARAALFDRFGPDFRRQVEGIAQTASNLRDGSRVFSNPSGSAASAAQISGATGLMALLGTGQLGAAGLAGGGMVANNLLARLLTNPGSAQWLAQRTQVPFGAVTPVLAESEENGGNRNNRGGK